MVQFATEAPAKTERLGAYGNYCASCLAEPTAQASHRARAARNADRPAGSRLTGPSALMTDNGRSARSANQSIRDAQPAVSHTRSAITGQQNLAVLG